MDNKRRKEFLEFLLRKESPPQHLFLSVQKDTSLSLRGRKIVLKFLSLQVLGTLISLTFCPQFGIGMMEGHGITHYLRHLGEIACAGFCGSLLLSSGAVVAIIGLNRDELSWVWKRYKYSLYLLPALIWSALMCMNISYELPKESVSYNVTWLLMAILAQGLIFGSRALYLERLSLRHFKE